MSATILCKQCVAVPREQPAVILIVDPDGPVVTAGRCSCGHKLSPAEIDAILENVVLDEKYPHFFQVQL